MLYQLLPEVKTFKPIQVPSMQPDIALPELPKIPDSVRFAAALGQFSESMKHFTQLHEQTSNRLSKIVRLGMIALATLFVAVFLMMLAMAFRINLMIENVSSINKHFHHMVPDISRMHAHMISMQENVATIQQIPIELTQMLSSIDDIHGHMSHMHDQMSVMNAQTLQIANKTESINQQVSSMEAPVTNMQTDISQMARPARLMNRMMPGR
jgi:hypothetical protein